MEQIQNKKKFGTGLRINNPGCPGGVEQSDWIGSDRSGARIADHSAKIRAARSDRIRSEKAARNKERKVEKRTVTEKC